MQLISFHFIHFCNMKKKFNNKKQVLRAAKIESLILWCINSTFAARI